MAVFIFAVGISFFKEKPQLSPGNIENSSSVVLSSGVTESPSDISVNNIDNLIAQHERDRSVVANWRVGRGYNEQGLSSYASYSDQTLFKLANEGDLTALHLLAEKVYRKDGYKAAEPYYIKAAAYGSTRAFLYLGTAEETSNYHAAKSEQDKRLSIIKTLAWYEVANLRGDPFPKAEIGSAFIENNNINLSQQDKAEIKRLAHAYYEGIQAIRAKYSLGNFDNSVPEEVKRTHSGWYAKANIF